MIMTFEEFSTPVNSAAPDHKPEAISIWWEFAVERVESEQFVHFKPMDDAKEAAEKWLDVICNGILAVEHSFGTETASALVNLSCERCCLYPGEMMQAAVCLNEGCGAEDIFALIESGDIDTTDLFSPMPQAEAMEVAEAAKTMRRRSSVLERLKQTEKGVESSKNKKEVERRRNNELLDI